MQTLGMQIWGFTSEETQSTPVRLDYSGCLNDFYHKDYEIGKITILIWLLF